MGEERRAGGGRAVGGRAKASTAIEEAEGTEEQRGFWLLSECTMDGWVVRRACACWDRLKTSGFGPASDGPPRSSSPVQKHQQQPSRQTHARRPTRPPASRAGTFTCLYAYMPTCLHVCMPIACTKQQLVSREKCTHHRDSSYATDLVHSPIVYPPIATPTRLSRS